MDSLRHYDAMIRRSYPAAETLSLCARGCGFFGTKEKRGMCSKCYADFFELNIMGRSESDQSNNTQMESEIDKLVESISCITTTNDTKNSGATVVKRRCKLCGKKVGLLGYGCRCGGTFCGLHRLPEEHSCIADYKVAGKTEIQKQNPVCKGDKFGDRL